VTDSQDIATMPPGGCFQAYFDLVHSQAGVSLQHSITS
jgi:hypothetical protein